MSRAINIISQIIFLAKKAKKQIKKRKYSSAKRLIRIILKFEKRELAYVRKESGSDKLYEGCLSILSDTEEAFEDLERFDVEKAESILDKVIDLERHELEIVKANEGLSEEVLRRVEPYIRELVDEINKLSFVKETTVSCSGHTESRFQLMTAYIVIIYDFNSRTAHNILPFDQRMKRICPQSGVPQKKKRAGPMTLLPLAEEWKGSRRPDVVYFLTDTSKFLKSNLEWLFSRKKTLERRLIKRWNLIFRLVKKYEDIDRLEYVKGRKYIKEGREKLAERIRR